MASQKKLALKAFLPASMLAAAVFAVPQAAFGGAKTYAYLETRDALFVSLDAMGNATPLVVDDGSGAGDISIVSFNEGLTNTAIRISGPGAGNDLTIGTASGGSPEARLLSTVNPGINPGEACVGDTCPGPGFTMGDFNADEYVRSLSDLNGAGFDIGLIDADDMTNTNISTSTTRLVSEAITQAGSNDIGDANVSTDVDFVFTTLDSVQAAFTATLLRQVFAGLHDDASDESTGSADATLRLNIVDLDNGNAFVPLEFSLDGGMNFDPFNPLQGITIGADIPNPGDIVDSGLQVFGLVVRTTGTLTPGTNYAFSADFDTNVDMLAIKAVPEPAPLALLALALLSTVVAVRKKGQKTTT